MSIYMAKAPENSIPGIIKTYNQRLSSFIRSRVPNQDDAEDILQEVWYQLSRVVDINTIEQMSGWLFRVARNKVTDRYRKKTPELFEDFSYENEEGETEFFDIMLEDHADPEMDNLKELFWEELWEALDELPNNQREVFIWNELEDQTFQEISDRTGINIKTLISRKRYAVLHLRNRLESLYKEFILFD